LRLLSSSSRLQIDTSMWSSPTSKEVVSRPRAVRDDALDIPALNKLKGGSFAFRGFFVALPSYIDDKDLSYTIREASHIGKQ
jgi:hypothetical protein